MDFNTIIKEVHKALQGDKEYVTAFLRIGFLKGSYSFIEEGLLYKMIKLFDYSKPLLKDFGLADKTKKGAIYGIKTPASGNATSIEGLLIYNKIKCFSHGYYVFSVPFNPKSIHLLRFEFSNFGGIIREDLEARLEDINFADDNKVPTFDELVIPYLDKEKPR